MIHTNPKSTLTESNQLLISFLSPALVVGLFFDPACVRQEIHTVTPFWAIVCFLAGQIDSIEHQYSSKSCLLCRERSSGFLNRECRHTASVCLEISPHIRTHARFPNGSRGQTLSAHYPQSKQSNSAIKCDSRFCYRVAFFLTSVVIRNILEYCFWPCFNFENRHVEVRERFPSANILHLISPATKTAINRAL